MGRILHSQLVSSLSPITYPLLPPRVKSQVYRTLAARKPNNKPTATPVNTAKKTTYSTIAIYVSPHYFTKSIESLLAGMRQIEPEKPGKS
jgi:hypothetical protein